jgi:hypothetical protein
MENNAVALILLKHERRQWLPPYWAWMCSVSRMQFSLAIPESWCTSRFTAIGLSVRRDRFVSLVNSASNPLWIFLGIWPNSCHRMSRYSCLCTIYSLTHLDESLSQYHTSPIRYHRFHWTIVEGVLHFPSQNNIRQNAVVFTKADQTIHNSRVSHN